MESARSLVLPLLAATVAAGAALAAYKMIRIRHIELKLAELEAALEHSEQQRAAERTGRIRAQRDLRKSLGGNDAGNLGDTAYSMTPIVSYGLAFPQEMALLDSHCLFLLQNTPCIESWWSPPRGFGGACLVLTLLGSVCVSREYRHATFVEQAGTP